MARTYRELAERLREGYEANNWAPALEVLAELEEAVRTGAWIEQQRKAEEAESCGDPVLGEPEDRAGEHVEDDPFAQDDPVGLPDRAHEDGEERPGLHRRTPKRPFRRRR